MGITAVLTDLIAVRLRSAALAGLPLLVLFGVPAMMNASHNQLADGLVFCLGGAGYLAMLVRSGRIRVWGRLSPVAPPRRSPAPRCPAAASGNARTPALAAAGRLGLASIAVALCAPLLLSGVHLSTLFSPGPARRPGARRQSCAAQRPDPDHGPAA